MKKLSFLGRCLTESLTSNTAPFVCILLAVPLREHGTNLNYILPVMLFYACMKTGLYFIQGTVHIENPYKIMKFGISTALAGSFFLLSCDPSGWMYLTGAVLTGIGLAPLSSMYKVICDNEDGISEHPNLRKVISTTILIAIGVWCMKSKTSGSIAVMYFWCVYIGLIGIYIFLLPERARYASGKLYTAKEIWSAYCFPSALLFFMMAAVSGYKSSGNILIFVLMLAALVLFIAWCTLFDKRVFHIYCSQTSWLGAIRGFEMLFALVFLAETQHGNLTIVLYEVIVAAGFFGFLPDIILSRLDSVRTVWACMEISLACMLLVISGNIPLMMAGIFLCVCFTNKGKSSNLDPYLNDSSVIHDEYHLRQDKMYSLGNGSFQAFTMIVFFIVGRIISGHGSSLMNTYVFSSDIEHGRAVLFISGLICIIGMLAWLIIIKQSSAKNSGSSKDNADIPEIPAC